MEILESQNKQYGFYGTTVNSGVTGIKREWAAAFRWVARAMPQWSAENIRNFLDSRIGRHLADEALELRGVAKVDPARWRSLMYEYAVEAGIIPRGEAKQHLELLRIAAALEKSEAELRAVMQTIPAEQNGPSAAYMVLETSVNHLSWIADALKKL